MAKAKCPHCEDGYLSKGGNGYDLPCGNCDQTGFMEAKREEHLRNVAEAFEKLGRRRAREWRLDELKRMRQRRHRPLNYKFERRDR